MKNVPLTAIAGQTCRLPLVVKNAEGTPIPLDAYDIYGAVDDGSPSKIGMTVALIEPGTACLSIPPLQTGRYEYDVFMRHQATSTETRLLRGAITVQSRVASLPPAQSTAEQIDIVLSPEHTVLEISLSPVTIVSAADWRQIQEAADRAERAAGQAEATLPALEREIAAARTAIEQEADQAARHAAAETADIIAASGEAATSAVRQEASRATSAALESISTAEATVIAQATNDGINAIGQSITAGTGIISDATASGKSSIDSYVLTTQANLALKSQPNIWGGVNTFNSSIVANGGLMIAGQDIMRTMWTSALNQTLAILSASGWADTSKGLQFGSAYNGLFYGAESGVTANGINTTGTLTRTDMAHYAVQKHIAMGSPGELSGLVTLVVRVDTNTVSSVLSKKTAYIFGQHMRDTGDVPFDQLISTDYTPNVGNIPTCILTLTDDDKLRLDVLYRTQHRQLILTPQGNFPLRNYAKYFVFVWTPTSFGLYWNAQYPPGPWECLVRITAPSMGELYRVSIHGYDDKNYWNIGMTRAVTSLNTLQPLGYADWMTPRITITE